MKKLLWGILLYGALSCNAQAANAIWRGDAFITSITGTCAKYDPTGSHLHVRYLPRNLGTNGPDSRFALFLPDYSQGFYLPNNAFSPTARTVQYKSIWDGGAFSPGFPVTVAFTATSPLQITATTQFLSIQGRITNYDFMQGCTINFRMALGLSTN